MDFVQGLLSIFEKRTSKITGTALRVCQVAINFPSPSDNGDNEQES